MPTDEQFEALRIQFQQLKAVVDPMERTVQRHEVYLQPVKVSPIVTRQIAENLYGPRAMQKNLSSGGAAPLPIDGLLGTAADIQQANIPEYSQLPELGDPSIKQGKTVHVSGLNYRRGKSGWEPLSTATTNIQQISNSGGAVGGGSVTPALQFITRTSLTVVVGTPAQNTTTKPIYIEIIGMVSGGNGAELQCDATSTPSVFVCVFQPPAATVGSTTFTLSTIVPPSFWWVVSIGFTVSSAIQIT